MTLSESILATIAYHDIFDYPLTKEEIYRYLIGKKASLKSLESEIVNLLNAKKIVKYSSSERKRVEKFSINSNNKFHVLRGRQKLFQTRKSSKIYSQSKLRRALFYSKLLTLVPTVLFVGITGALAMNNSKKKDDIDLILICTKGTLWTTRFLANMILLPFKRRPNDLQVSNKACLNLFLDESELKISPQNLYIAHEICQMKVLWDRDNIYKRFLNANRWVFKFLPNWAPIAPPLRHPRVPLRHPRVGEDLKSSQALVFRRLALVTEPLEALAKWGQLWYMRSKITTEKIGKHQLFFHPANTQDWVMWQYQKRLRRLGFAL